MNITGDFKLGREFQITNKPTNLSDSTFIAVTSDIFVTSRLSELWIYPDETVVLAHWHGKYRTDCFSTTVGELKSKALESGYILG